ncbi:hypothetical protein LENED_008412 [Lentinula edodes]|uniref:Uncharacterized protein n=1 Tax=Lentinula edodes TaxID=5353 RepID=A0A1Q3EH54_LENED|nr:hypothetical protein LENED_008412 [Lentinula edodes]
MTSSDVDSESGRSSPILASINSSSALILVHDDEEEGPDVNYAQDLEDVEDDGDSPYLGITRPYVQPLSPTTVLLYLLAPYLKLGAILLPNADLPLRLSIPLLLAFAVLAVFARQIWYMLSRYLRKGPGEEDILVDAFSLSKGSRITRQHYSWQLRIFVLCLAANGFTLGRHIAHATNSAATKTPLSRSFKILSIISVVLAVCLTLPLLVFAAFPNKPQADIPSYRVIPFILALSSITLLLGIPLVLTTTPSLPLPERFRRSTTIPLSKTFIFVVVVLLSIVPMYVSRVYNDVLIVCALVGTYFLPELMLQRKQFGRRVIWDIGVWTLLLPVGGGGFVWAIGRIAGRW